MDRSDVPELDEKFELLGKLGEGGMGAIFKVRHRLLNQILVVKTMTPRSSASPELQKRFLREAQTATRLRHPSIVSILDFVLRKDGSAYMVMEYLEGANLADAVRRCGRMPPSLVLFIGDQALSALDFMHEKGVIHRDIAPDNMMLTREESGVIRVKLIDLGIAKILNAGEELTVVPQFIGKLRYASPEQLALHEAAGVLDGRTDIYSFGTVAYELLTGVKAFRGNSILALFQSHQSGAIVPFEESDPHGEVSPELREILLRAMAVNPDDRFATAGEFRHSLSSLLSEEPLDDPAARAYVQAVLGLSPHDLLSVEGPRRFGSSLSPGGSPPRPISGRSRWTNGSDRNAASSAAQPVEEERTQRTPPPAPKVGSTSASSEPLSRDGPSVRETLPRPADFTVPKVIQREPKTDGVGEVAPALPPAELRRRWRLVTLVIPAVLAIVVGLALLLWLGRPRREQRRADEAPARTPRPAVSASLPATPVASMSSSTAPMPTAVPSPELRTRSTRAAAVSPSLRPTLVAQLREVPTVAMPALASTSSLDRSLPEHVRFCTEVDVRTSFEQGNAKERPKGFSGDTGEFVLSSRTEFGRIEIRLSVTPKEPAEGGEFQVVGEAFNGSDRSLVIERVEESLPAGTEGFQDVAGENVPFEIESRSTELIYKYAGRLSGRTPFRKELRIIDTRKDIWRRGIWLRPCPGP